MTEWIIVLLLAVHCFAGCIGDPSLESEALDDANRFTTQPDSQDRYLVGLSSDHALDSTGLLAQISSNISFNPRIDTLLTSFDRDIILEDIRTLGGGDHSKDGRSGWITRHSYSQGAVESVHWLKDQYERLDHVHCEFDHYLVGVAPNLICKILWSFNDTAFAGSSAHDDTINWDASHEQAADTHSVVLTAHYDSKGSFGFIDAPGVDDNASGCAVLLSIARLIQKHQEEINELKRNISRPGHQTGPRKKTKQKLFEIVFIHLSGTEQGLIGSQSIANKFGQQVTVDKDENNRRLILLLINVNMISYRIRYEPRQMGLSNLGCSPESLEFMTRISNAYVPELVVGNTSIGLSDEVNFQRNGIPNSIRVFESLGSTIKNPNYMKSSDIFSNFLQHDDRLSPKSEGFYDIFQVILITKVLLASVLELLLSYKHV